jgi:hypothetical protein
MNKPALLLSLLALGALALVVFEGGDGDQTTAVSEAETAGDEYQSAGDEYQNLRPYYRQLAVDMKSCGTLGRYRFAVVEGDVLCR